MIRNAPLTPQERKECYAHLAAWVSRRSKPHHPVTYDFPTAKEQPIIDVDAVVPGRGGSRARAS
jgi:hypothetical protein